MSLNAEEEQEILEEWEKHYRKAYDYMVQRSIGGDKKILEEQAAQYATEIISEEKGLTRSQVKEIISRLKE